MIQAEFKTRLDEARQKMPKIKVDWEPSADPRAKYNASKLALIIEPRPIPHLVPQLLHMTSVVPPDWRFLFIGSNKSVISVARSYGIKHQQVIGKLDLMVLPEPWRIDTKEHVFRLLTDMRFYDEFLPGVEWILKFESDSILCSNSPTSLNEWLGWSWAGAPKSPDDRFSGNGGLSLRRVSSIKKVLQFQERYNDTEAEDEWFGKRLWVMKGEKVAHGNKGVLAVEDVYMEKPMGYHVRDGGNSLSDAVWKDPKQRKKIFNYCPELSMIMDMKLERERCDDDNGEGGLGPTDAEKAAAAEAAKKAAAEEAKKAAEEAAKKAVEEAKKAAEAAAKKQQEEEQKAAEAAAKKQQEEEQKAAEEEQKSKTGTSATQSDLDHTALITGEEVAQLLGQNNAPNGDDSTDLYADDALANAEASGAQSTGKDTAYSVNQV
ncbi:hypothetical protein LX32DRAFT_602539 [Colletotrichum zoysiae]|uniref:DUF5672 domain-containing protein n=1 Tax=Colletotrichum zoysiae TaxID=1216348 RepID=A0AAD9H6P8_9PEZI|nr:hypothetical protein LX32DRAFT_602539 [Colletotrichum zoysiae]